MHVSVNIVGDAFADVYCYLENEMPAHGGDARLTKPIHTVAGGSALNTATHLSSLLRHFWVDDCDAIIASTSKREDATLPCNPTLSIKGEDGPAKKMKTDSNTCCVSLQTVFNENDSYGKIIVSHAQEHKFTLYNRRISNHPCCSFDASESMTKSYVGTSGISGVGLKSTGHCAVIVSKGDRSFMTHLGCMEDFRGEHILTSVPDGRQSSKVRVRNHVHIAGYYNIAGFWNGELATKLKDMQHAHAVSNVGEKMTISLVPQQDATNEWDGGLLGVLKFVDFLILSEVEAISIAKYKAPSSRETEDDRAMLEFIANFFNSKSPTTYVVLTRGARGAVVLYDNKLLLSQETTRKIDNPIDPTGAGDAFAAGFIYGYLSHCAENTERGQSLCKQAIEKGLKIGCANGTCCVMVQGASVPSSKQVLERMIGS